MRPVAETAKSAAPAAAAAGSEVLQRLIDCLSEPAFLIDDAGTIGACNAAAEGLVAPAGAPLAGANLIEALIPAASHEAALLAIARATVTGARPFEHNRVELPLAAAEGGVRPAELVFDTLDEAGGLHLVTVARTAAITGAAAPPPAAAAPRALADLAATAMLLFDGQGRVADANPAAARLLRAAAPGALRGAGYEAIWPTGAGPGEHPFAAVEAGQALAAEEARFRCLDGGELDVAMRGAASRDALGCRWLHVSFVEAGSGPVESRLIEVVSAIAQRLGGVGDLQQGLDIVVGELGGVLGWDVAEAWVLQERSVLRRMASWARPGLAAGHDFLARTGDLEPPAPGTLREHSRRTGAPQWLDDIASDALPATFRRKVGLDCGLRTACALPLVVEGTVVAVLTFLARRRRDHFWHLIRAIEKLVPAVSALVQRLIAGQELRLRSEQLGLALAASRTVAWCYDVERERIAWGEGAAALFGLSAEALGEHRDEFLRHLPAADARDLEAALQRTLAERVELTARFRLGQQAGAPRGFGVRGRLQHGRGGRPLRIAGVCWEQTGAGPAGRDAGAQR